ncbi:MAG: PAS domain-containing protein [Polyangiaceae bacterium]|nr:PAS domain-containing protein [Polyangiaceae bacterium]
MTRPWHELRLDRGGAILAADAELAAALGCEAGELVGRRLDELASPVDPVAVQDYIDRVTSVGLMGLDLVLCWRVKGVDHPVHLTVGGAADALVGWVQVARPGSALGELVLTRTLWRSVVAAMSDGVAVLDGAGRVVEHNAAFFRLLGARTADGAHVVEEFVAGRSFADLVAGTGLDAVVPALAASKPRLRRFQGRVRHCGRELDVELSPAVGAARASAACALILRDRTADAELAHAHAQLSQEIAERERIEVNLRQKQKLEAVGQLAAGIAHEINTPVQYIADTSHFLRDGVTDLYGLLAATQQALEAAASGANAGGLLESLEARRSEIDFEYLEQQTGPAFARLLDGAEQVATIVRAMKEFSHPGHKDMAEADLNRALENTLIVSRNSYKYVANVVTELGELPRVKCTVGEISQVLLNLVVNAAHAIEDVRAADPERAERPGTITVRSWRDGPDACISVGDDGTGIPDDIRERIFDPFFTTKSVGRGTGQGLSLAHSVAERHAGRIELSTSVGVGTTFTLRVPIAGPAQQASTPTAA